MLKTGKYKEVTKTEIKINGEVATGKVIAELFQQDGSFDNVVEFIRYNLELNPNWEMVKTTEIIQQIR